MGYTKMREMRRNAGHVNARNGGLLPLAIVLFSVLAFVMSILFVVAVPTYADSVQAAESGEINEGGGQSSSPESRAVDDGPEKKLGTPTDGEVPEVALMEDAVAGADSQLGNERTENATANEPANVSQSDVPTPKSRGRFRRAAALTASSCLNGSVFSIRADGTLVEIFSSGRTREFPEVPTEDWQRRGSYPYPQESDLRSSVNALGVGANAEDIYAIRHYEYRYDPYAELGEWDYVIYKYNHDARRWVRQTVRKQSGLNAPYIAGAVQLNTGMFYFGAYDAPGSVNNVRRLRFRLYRLDPRNGTTREVGYFDTGRQLAPGEPYNSAANGDMAFDEEGNLFVVRSGSRSYGSSVKETSIHSITADSLARADGGYIPASSTVPIRTDGSINGIAFDAHGRLYLGDVTTVRQHDPIDYENLGVFKNGLFESRDLASCASPATIRLRKNVKARRATNDQFVLNLKKNGAGGKHTAIPSVTTTGNRNGLQAETIGVFPVRTGTRYTFSENMADSSSSVASDYRSTWRCEDKNGQIAAGEGNSGSVTIPNTASAEVICTFTNIPLNGSLAWEKVDGDDRNTHLEGSVWTLGGPLASGRSQTVRDCMATDASQCRSGDNDTDPRAGYFKVDGLYLGQYTLREHTPPSGYEGTAQTFTQTLTADKQQRSFGKIDNKKLVAQIEVKKEVRDPAGDKVANAADWSLAVDLDNHLHSTLAPLKDRNDPWFGKRQVSNVSGTVPELWTVNFPNSTTRQDVRITEAGKATNYAASIRCTSNKRQPVAGTGSGLNVPDLQPGEKLTCVVTNKQLPGSVVWEKTDASGTYLAGSEWSVTTSQQGVIAVQDCVNAGACRSGGDRDPQPGRFRLEGLKWQNLSLEETVAPPGYRRDTAVRTQTIGENALQADFGRITNETVILPLLPLTGGMGADSFLMAGTGILTLAFGAAAMRRLQFAGAKSHTARSLYQERRERSLK